MEHSDIRHKLSEYIDGSVSDEERVEIKVHLEACKTCSNALQKLLKTIENISTMEEGDSLQ